jgi:uncharacterized protein
MAGRSPAAAEAEAHYRRMCELAAMREGELAAALQDEPAQWIESAARYGVAEAQLRLGQLLLDGTGASRDPAAALAWFERAAAQGLPAAMNMVGRCLENGWGAPVDLPGAAAWYRRAAEAGLDWGEYNYANLLFDGRGVAQDQAAACAWYAKAATQDHARAMNLLARCCEEGWGVARDPAAARDWYRRSAEAGYFRAQYNHATLLAAEGRVGDAALWFERALAGAPAEARTPMAAALSRHPDRRIAALARRQAA